MGQALTAIADYAEQHVGKLSEHPLVGRPTLSVGTINGGLSVNTVPDRCTVAIDRRLAPGECADAAQQHVVDHLAKRCPDLELVHDVPFLVSPGLESRLNGELAERLAKTSRAHGGSGVLKGVPFGTDAGAVSNSGVPAVVFGPGSIRQAHTRDEWIDVAPLEQAVDILLDFCWSFAE